MPGKVLKQKELSKRLALKEKIEKTPVGSRVGVLSDTGGGVLNKKTLAAQTRADEIIEEARREADAIRSEARDLLGQVEAKLAAEKERGYREGREAGLASVTQQVATFEKGKEVFYKNAEENIIRLVMSVAEKVIGRIVQENSEAIISVVKLAIESALGDRILVRLNPGDYKRVMAAEPQFQEVLDRTQRIAFKEDEKISPGGCMVETEVGTIDARLETQLEAIRKALEL